MSVTQCICKLFREKWLSKFLILKENVIQLLKKFQKHKKTVVRSFIFDDISSPTNLVFYVYSYEPFIWKTCYEYLKNVDGMSLIWSNCSAVRSRCYTRGKKDTDPYNITPIVMRSLWMEIKYVKCAAKLLNRDWINKRGLDLSKKVLWVSVGERAANLRAVKVGGQKKILPISPVRAIRVRTGAIGRIFFDLQLWQPVKLLPFDL